MTDAAISVAARLGRLWAMEADAERDEGQDHRDDDRNGDQCGIVSQQRLRLHRRHSGIVHRADPGAHQNRADDRRPKPGFVRRADRA